MYTETFPGTDIENFDSPPSDPIALLQQWLPAAPEGDPTRTIMALATMGVDGYPNIRHVLASEIDNEGISFHVSSTSVKVQELESTPKAAITMVWPSQGKQLIVQGLVRKQSALEAENFYYQRPRYLQVLAHVNSNELARKPASERKEIWDQFVKNHPEKIPPPDTWLGFVLVPTRISFWRAIADTPSNRHDYRLNNGKWDLEIVAG